MQDDPRRPLPNGTRVICRYTDSNVPYYEGWVGTVIDKHHSQDREGYKRGLFCGYVKWDNHDQTLCSFLEPLNNNEID